MRIDIGDEIKTKTHAIILTKSLTEENKMEIIKIKATRIITE